MVGCTYIVKAAVRKRVHINIQQELSHDGAAFYVNEQIVSLLPSSKDNNGLKCRDTSCGLMTTRYMDPIHQLTSRGNIEEQASFSIQTI